MAESKIEWTRYTFNPWRGCTRVSPGCDHCYAETLSKRNPKVLGVWGDDGTRVVAAESYWRAPLKWNAEAEAAGVRERVFCASLADWLEDRRELDAPRHRLFDLIQITPALDWLLLTKRPQNFDKLSPGPWVVCGCPPNVWLGATAEDQERANERIPILLTLPARVRFISAEPLLGPLDLHAALHLTWVYSAGQGDRHPSGDGRGGWWTDLGTMPHDSPKLDWVIIGGESGPGARPMRMEWAQSIIEQCRTAGVPVFCKQLGAHPVLPNGVEFPMLHDPRKGGNPEDWPTQFRVREFPS